MSLVPGTRLGPYEILAPIGAGGMGEVYRARDTRLDRHVAVKTLPAGVSADPERRQRFEREARAIAALNQPHICTLYDVGEHDGTAFLVMELLEGETLAARLERGPLDLASALACAIQMAEALDRAHRQGIVHRDLKPGNIMLTRPAPGRTGTPHVKLLDFGLARLAGERPVLVDGATATAAVTVAGQILGTLHYMAPEQLEGRPVDARADIFAFGAIVFEMITGGRAFEGASPASLIGAILHKAPPPIAELVPGAPPALERVLAICLAKDPDARWSSMHDVRLQLSAIAEARDTGPASAPPAAGRRERVAWAVAAAAALTALVLAAVAGAGRGAAPPAGAGPHVLSVLPPGQVMLMHGEAPQISPDGRRVAFVGRDDSGDVRLYIRELDSPAARPLPGTEEASLPFWAPDSRRLGYFARGHLRTVALAGGPPSTIAPAPVPRGGTWSRDDLILYVAVPARPPLHVPATGGSPEVVPMPEGDPALRWFPKFLPDGRHYLFLEGIPAVASGRKIRVASLDSAVTEDVLSSDASAVFAAPGHILFRRDGTLVAQRFDARARRLSGSPAPVADDVGFNGITYQALFSASETGRLAYQEAAPGAHLTWFDRTGKRLDEAVPAGDQNNFCLASDGTRIVYEQADAVSGNIDLWTVDAATRVPTRLTFERTVDFYPVCSPSGAEVVFASLRRGPPGLFRLALDSPGSEVPISLSSGPKIPTDWSRDGRLIVYSVLRPETSWDIEVLSLADEQTTAVVATGAEELNARLSPDGRWIAYVSNEGGTFDVYVQRFPPAGTKWQVTRGGGLQPHWSADGRQLYYLAPDRSLLSLAVTAGPTGVTFGEPRVLMATAIVGWEQVNQGSQYAVTADGQRVLVSTAVDAIRSITVAVDWPALMAR